jgi:DNA-binding transcriptional MerR regulator
LTFDLTRRSTVVSVDGWSISEAAARTGFPPSTLRFYDQAGLVCPARTPAGYRSYDEQQIQRLRFIGRAKTFGLSLDEITDLVALLERDRCSEVQGRLRELVAAKVADARRRMSELLAFIAELETVAATLDVHTADGPCDERCGCTTSSIAGAVAARPGLRASS